MRRVSTAGLSYLPGQAEIPGTARVRDGEKCRRRAAEPLRATKPQRPCDHGLFSDNRAQIDLIDIARARAHNRM
jgi:hypothetical protein